MTPQKTKSIENVVENPMDKEPQLLQLRFKEDPWRLLVGCILLNRTQRKQVDRVIDDLFSEYPTATAMECARTADVQEILRPLGLSAQRAHRLVEFSYGWNALLLEVSKQEGVMSRDEFLARLGRCAGVGKYALDSYRIFVFDEWREVAPEDKELVRWRRWRRRQEQH